jgi:hypothetical protein
MAMVTMVAGKQTEVARKRAMAIKTREVGKEEGNGKGGKSNGNGKEEGNGKEDGMESVLWTGWGSGGPGLK